MLIRQLQRGAYPSGMSTHESEIDALERYQAERTELAVMEYQMGHQMFRVAMSALVALPDVVRRQVPSATRLRTDEDIVVWITLDRADYVFPPVDDRYKEWSQLVQSMLGSLRVAADATGTPWRHWTVGESAKGPEDVWVIELDATSQKARQLLRESDTSAAAPRAP